MCGRFALTLTAESLRAYYGLLRTPDVTPRWNIAPSQQVLIVRAEADGPAAARARWGLVPRWAKDESIGGRMINARSETASEKPAFREAFRARRCVVPADGFYEWAGASGGAVGASRRRPYWVAYAGVADEATGEVEREPMSFAGLWERWRHPGHGGDAVESVTILTTEANEQLRRLHHRMPVALRRDEINAWLDGSADRPADLAPLLASRPWPALELTPVSTRVNNPRHDDRACRAPERTGDRGNRGEPGLFG